MAELKVGVQLAQGGRREKRERFVTAVLNAVSIEAFLDRGDREAPLDALLGELDGAYEDVREHLRRAIIGILSEADTADPIGPKYHKRLATDRRQPRRPRR